MNIPSPEVLTGSAIGGFTAGVGALFSLGTVQVGKWLSHCIVQKLKKKVIPK